MSGTTAARGERHRAVPVDGQTVIGATLNGRPRRLTRYPDLLGASTTRWVRAFIDIRQKFAVGDPATDPDVVALRAAHETAGCALIVSLKWDFSGVWGTKERMRVPGPGSPAERHLFDRATAFLDAIGVPLGAVVLGNEPMWETPPADIIEDPEPILGFTRRLASHLVAHGAHGDTTYLVGSVNRLDSRAVQEGRFAPFYRRLVEMVEDEPHIAGLDLHVHFARQRAARAMVAGARESLPDATLTVTEFSPVWRYRQRVGRAIGDWAPGRDFAAAHGISPRTTAVEYFEAAKRDPVAPAELAALYDALPWYNVDHISDMQALFAEYDVSLATIGFLQDAGMRQVDWTSGWTPFHINALFQAALTAGEVGADTANRHYIDDYRALTGR